MSKKKVLYIDDGPTSRKTVEAFLKSLDLTPIVVAEVKDFIQKLKDESPDLCLVDVNIGSIGDGLVLVRAIRNKIGNELPIILVSSKGESSEIAQGLSSGADDYIVKPVDKAMLASKISNFISQEVLEQNQLPIHRIPPEIDSSGYVNIEISLESVNEQGIQGKSSSMLFENTKISLSYSEFDSSTDMAGEMDFIVTTTWLSEANGEPHFVADLDENMKDYDKAVKFIEKVLIS